MRSTSLTALLAAALAIPAIAHGDAPAPSGKPIATQAAKRCPDRSAQTTAERSVRVSLACRGLGHLRIRVLRRPRHGLVIINQKRDRARYLPDRGHSGKDNFIIARRWGTRSLKTVVRIRVRAGVRGGPGEVPFCGKADANVRYQAPTQVSITCTGNDLQPLTLSRGPFSGELTNLQEGGSSTKRTLSATYTPDDLFVGGDALVVDAIDPDGSAYGVAALEVLPWRLRAIGDSVTAGFGYFEDGNLMPVDDLLACKPAAVVSNRCSSNSDAGPDYPGPPAWSPDFGLANDISWAAQFANDWQGGGHITGTEMFQNRAVTGSAPSDWLPGGILNPQLKAIVAEDPELVAMTMGANPLLSNLLLTTEGEECSFHVTVAAVKACIQTFFDQAQLTARLEQIYTALLQAPHTNVIAFQYSLSIPALNLFAIWQLEVMIDAFNEQIADAVAATKAHVPVNQGERLHLIEAQTDPAAPEPDELPRFNVGFAPSIHDSWSGVYDCGGLFDVDGPSNQSGDTQDLYEFDPNFCPGPSWIINADSGIHPNKDGYAQFATALTNYVQGENLIPPLP